MISRRSRLGRTVEVFSVVIVDTTVWVDYFRGIRNPETDWLDTELDRQRLGLTDIILCEVLQGVRDDSAAADVERGCGSWRTLKPAESSLHATLHATTVFFGARGHTVRKTIDCLIATFCTSQRSLVASPRSGS